MQAPLLQIIKNIVPALHLVAVAVLLTMSIVPTDLRVSLWDQEMHWSLLVLPLSLDYGPNSFKIATL